MKSFRSAAPLGLLLAALVTAGCVSNRSLGDVAANAPAAHPRVKNADATCTSCHEGTDPQVVAAWERGPHGFNLVPCYTCHGATDEGFIPEPGPRLCEGCHASAVQTVTGLNGRIQACFTCHEPHSLAATGKSNPHQAGKAEGR